MSRLGGACGRLLFCLGGWRQVARVSREAPPGRPAGPEASAWKLQRRGLRLACPAGERGALVAARQGRIEAAIRSLLLSILRSGDWTARVIRLGEASIQHA